MKPVVLTIAVAAATVFGPAHLALATCSQGGQGGQEPCTQGGQFGESLVDPYAPISDVPYDSVLPATNPVRPSVPSTPAARITVVDAGAPASRPVKKSLPTARLTVVNDTAASPPKKVDAKLAETLDAIQAKADKVAAGASATEEQIDPALKGLVGTWLAVARHGDGELATVELQLDDRGWAKLTVPGADGKPSTLERRVKLEDDVLKLTGPEAEVILGQLIESNSRQLVLARNDSQVTFVRP
jgi:hypothetical protein